MIWLTAFQRSSPVFLASSSESAGNEPFLGFLGGLAYAFSWTFTSLFFLGAVTAFPPKRPESAL
jgi:hypothetical protein